MMVVMVTEMILPDRPDVFPHERSGKGITGANSLKKDHYHKEKYKYKGNLTHPSNIRTKNTE